MLPPDVVDSIVKKVNRGFKGGNRQLFLSTLRDDPESVQRWVAGNLVDWVTIECIELRQPIIVNDNDGSDKQLVEAFKAFFKAEISQLPPSQVKAPAPA